MITYETLSRRPTAFRSLTGFTPEAFDALFAAFLPAHQQRSRAATTTKRHGTPRARAPGAGPPFAHDLKARLLMALIWRRVYSTFEVLGVLFSLNKNHGHATVADMLETLATMADFAFERPAKERKQLRSLSAVLDAFPDVCLGIDAKEPRLQRPKSSEEDDRQKPDYSGKKQGHPLKSPIGVAPDGRVGAVSESVPGGAVHDLTLLRTTGLIERLDPTEEAGMLDQGYTGIGHDSPEYRLYLPYKARRNPPLTAEETSDNRHLSRYRIVVEHTLAQLNPFQALAQVYRHAREEQTRTVRVVAMLVNRRIQERPLKTYAVA